MKEKRSWLEKNIPINIQIDLRAERENTITHAFGIVFAIVVFILVFGRLNGMPTRAIKVGSLIYCSTLLLLYTASTLYHYLPLSDAKRLFRIIDHSNIYLLIAGSYTPVLLYINNSQTVLICLSLWFVCIFGILFSTFFMKRFKAVHVSLYLIMGWVAVFFWNDIIPNIPEQVVYYIIAGGLAYTLGVIFYSVKKIPHYHAIWHLFVLLGTVLHFIGFIKYIF